MKVTIQLREDLRAKLQELAAQRGDKGISKLVQESIVRYLEDLDRAALPADEGRLEVLRERAQVLLGWLRDRSLASYGRVSALVRTRFGTAEA